MSDIISKQSSTEDDIECEEFYNICQAYRHAKDNGDASNAYNTLKQYIAELLINSAPVVNSEAIARVVYDTWKDEKGVIYRKDRPQIWSLVKDDVLLALEKDAKLFTAPPQPQASRDALEKQGLAIVPMRLTKEMKAIFSEEEWEWKDLLAAAEAITEQQYSALIEHDAPSAPTNLKIRRSEL